MPCKDCAASSKNKMMQKILAFAVGIEGGVSIHNYLGVQEEIVTWSCYRAGDASYIDGMDDAGNVRRGYKFPKPVEAAAWLYRFCEDNEGWFLR